ncbi:G-protein coupled receptor Mth2-like [Asterias rubens]|uniref:G-protein coupled receptor Mth2-like n=1 Tax=Asterias rubens TaxID=7604 RepID=UPI001455BB58|nr:G-protein coupled receptor Mth2-like [Asterias rubens]
MVGKVSVHCLCVMRAALLHFSWLAVFVWMTVMASDLAKSITSKSPPNQRSGSNLKVVKLGIVAWGTPTIFVCACYLISRLSEDQSWGWLEYGGDQCWIVDSFHSLLAFGVPVAVLLIINCMLAVFMIYKVSSNRRRLAAAQISCNSKTELLLCFKLIVITGVTWSLFFAANLVNSPILWYIVVVVNSLQGALIGMLFLLKKRMMTLWRNKLTVIFCISCRRRHRTKKGAEPSPVNLVSVTVTPGDAPQMQDERPEIDKLK